MGAVGAVYINFGLWAVAIAPAWLLIRRFGADQEHYGHDGKPEVERGSRDGASEDDRVK